MALPNLPVQGQTPWFTPRNNWDLAVKSELEGRLSEQSLTSFVASAISDNEGVIYNYDTIYDLMASDAPDGAKVSISGFISYDDSMTVTYRIESGQRADRVLRRIAVPLDDGRWAVPLFTRLLFENSYDARVGAEMERVARTYIAAGADLIYDSSRQGPLNNPIPVHQAYPKPYPITCSVFGNLVMMGMPYAQTTYVADTNTRKFPWGETYPTREFLGPPLQAHRMLQYFIREEKAIYYREGITELKRGDMIFYCKQDPEGVGTGGVYFFNSYHNALYIGNGNLIHAYGVLSGNGVVQQPMSETPIADICFVVRGNAAHEVIESGTAVNTAIGINGFSGNVSNWYDNDMFIMSFDGLTTSGVGAGNYQSAITLPPGIRPLTTYSGVIHSTAGHIIRVRVNTDRTVTLTTFGAIPSGATFYGSINAPIRLL